MSATLITARAAPAGRTRALRRASVYLPILLVSTVAATLGVGGLLMVQAHARTTQLRGEAAIARANALSGIEIARARIAADIYWRTNNVNGAWLTNQSMGATGGTCTVSVTNPFGALSRQDTDPVIITGTGAKGNASQTMSVMVKPESRVPLTCLTSAIGVAGNISLSNAKIPTNNVTISANGDVIAVSPDSDIDPDVEAVGVISGRKYKGSTNTGITAKTFPPANLFNLYPTATVISVAGLPRTGANPAVRNCLLSPAANPFGATNSRGIYLIDCAGGQLIIQDCRIVGTLIIRNASLVTVKTRVAWEPAEATLPALLVEGTLRLELDGNNLSESSLMPLTGSIAGVNLNPSGSPYPYLTGGTDSDKSDNYTTKIDGLVYASGNVSIGSGSDVTIHSLFVGGDLGVNNPSTVRLTRDSRYYDAPPPGFYTVRNVLLPGTFR